jgi:hypothetical protein
MITHELPPRHEMMNAFLNRDAGYDGVFVTAVATTGIFCRPSCTARKPRPENVDFFPAARDALMAGYRPCLRCRPLEPAELPRPGWRIFLPTSRTTRGRGGPLRNFAGAGSIRTVSAGGFSSTTG